VGVGQPSADGRFSKRDRQQSRRATVREGSRPFAGPAAVLAHLSRCAQRVAISNQRLLALDERGEHLARARELLHVIATESPLPETPITNVQPTFVCPHCGAAMIIAEIFGRGEMIRAPPRLRAACCSKRRGWPRAGLLRRSSRNLDGGAHGRLRRGM